MLRRVMGTPWDRAGAHYIEEWVPRFVPYHLDLVQELVLAPGHKALIVSSGPGAEVIAVARAVGDKGHVRATDPSAEMVGIASAQVKRAGFTNVAVERAEPRDAAGARWNAIICAFGMWKIENRTDVLKSWAAALTPSGKIGILTFGPPDDSDPFTMLAQSLRELEPGAQTAPAGIPADRDSMHAMFDEAGLSLVRHTVLRHIVSFPSAEAFVAAIREGRTWRRVWEELGEERMNLVTARFYDRLGGPTAPLSFEPVVTLAIAALPGAEVELLTRPSAKAPPLSSPASSPKLPKDVDPYKD